MKTRTNFAALMIGALAYSALATQAMVDVLPQGNSSLIMEGAFSSGQIGALPPAPWKSSKNTAKVSVTLERPAGRPEGERWVRLVDDSAEEVANVRQSFEPLKKGRFQARLIANKLGGPLYFYLGSGPASKPAERAVQLSIDSDGALVVRCDEQKPKTSMRIKLGGVYLVRCDFETINDGKALRVVAELVEEASQQQSRVETESHTPLPVTTVRVTTIKSDTGADYYVTGLSIESR